MIRPITCLSLLLACGSGLYLYQTKHKVHVLDTRIDAVVHQTAQVRERIRVLHAEWTLLDQPERLQQLATQFLALQPTKPTQFVAIGDLNSVLPPPLPPQPEVPVVVPGSESPALVASAPPPETQPDAPAPPASAAVPPSRHEATSVASLSAYPAVAARGSDRPPARATERAAEPGRATLASVRIPPVAAQAPRPSAPRLVAGPRPLPAYRPAYEPPFARPAVSAMPNAATQAYGGSLLGMARGAAPPPPTPAPVWVNWNR